MRKVILISLMVFSAVSYTLWNRYLWPGLGDIDVVKKCGFGDLPQSLITEMEKRASILARSRWAPLEGDERALSLQIRGRIDDLSGIEGDINLKLAAAYVVLRHYQGVYLKTSGHFDDFSVYDGKITPGSNQKPIVYSYKVPSRQLDRFGIIFKNDIVNIWIVITGDPDDVKYYNAVANGGIGVGIIRVDAINYFIGKVGSDVFYKDSNECPLVPSQGWSDDYRRWKTSKGKN